MDNTARAMHGHLASQIGSPDFASNCFRTNAVDTIANIMHALEIAGEDVGAAVDMAWTHFYAEVSGDDD